jgi:FMN phosphatase YigB (HAD superfamily)
VLFRSVPARRAVFVGDDLDADIAGAANAGLRTIHVMHDVQATLDRPWIRPDARVPRISSVPRSADRLMEGERRANVA